MQGYPVQQVRNPTKLETGDCASQSASGRYTPCLSLRLIHTWRPTNRSMCSPTAGSRNRRGLLAPATSACDSATHTAQFQPHMAQMAQQCQLSGQIHGPYSTFAQPLGARRGKRGSGPQWCTMLRRLNPSRGRVASTHDVRELQLILIPLRHLLERLHRGAEASRCCSPQTQTSWCSR